MDTSLKHLYEAAHAGNVNSLNKLLKEDNLLLDRVVTTIAVNDNPLHIAAFLGHASFAKEIIQRKPELAREFNKQGMSPLHLAAAQGHLGVVNELLQVDADLCNLPEKKDGYLLVHIAVIKGKHDLIRLLIEKYKNSLNGLTFRLETFLHIAVKANSLETIEFLTAQGVMQLKLNERDSNKNTCLHLAFAGRQQQVIKHLLRQENIDVNPINSAGLTPLDVLLVTNNELWDLYLGEMIRNAGGKTAKELGTSETILTDSTSIDVDGTSQASVLSTPANRVRRTQKKSNDNTENNLIVVATLVATVTFAAALNPPGGFIQMPFDENDRNNSTRFSIWHDMNSTDPAGSPVYLWELKKFFMFDFFALYASISVVVLCLHGVGTINTMMQLMRFVLWSSIFSMVLALNSAMSILVYRHKTYKNSWVLTQFFAIWQYGFYLSFGYQLGGFVSSLASLVLRILRPLTPSWMSNLCGPNIQRCANQFKIIKGILAFIFAVVIGAIFGVVLEVLAASSTSA